jgi:hypothetical protein
MREVSAHAQNDNRSAAAEIFAIGTYFPNTLSTLWTELDRLVGLRTSRWNPCVIFSFNLLTKLWRHLELTDTVTYSLYTYRVTRIKRNPCLGWNIFKIECKQMRDIYFLKFGNAVKTSLSMLQPWSFLWRNAFQKVLTQNDPTHNGVSEPFSWHRCNQHIPISDRILCHCAFRNLFSLEKSIDCNSWLL